MDNFMSEQQKLNAHIGKALNVWTSGAMTMAPTPPLRKDTADGTPNSKISHTAIRELLGGTRCSGLALSTEWQDIILTLQR